MPLNFQKRSPVRELPPAQLLVLLGLFETDFPMIQLQKSANDIILRLILAKPKKSVATLKNLSQ